MMKMAAPVAPSALPPGGAASGAAKPDPRRLSGCADAGDDAGTPVAFADLLDRSLGCRAPEPLPTDAEGDTATKPERAQPQPDDAPLDPAAMPWLAALAPPAVAPKPDAVELDTPSSATAPALEATGHSTGAPVGTADAGRTERRGAGAHAAPLQAGPSLAAAVQEAASEPEAAATVDAAGPLAAHTRTEPVHLAESTVPHTPAAETSHAPAAPAAIELRAPVDSADFAPALGVQVSVLARDGVQQAELRLNPAEMGPVSVQIALDGTQARVHFGAEIAATRSAIESSLPDLAAALRDAGFTLAGGGVSTRQGGARQDSGEGGDGPRGGRRLAAGSASAGPVVQGVTPRASGTNARLGGVDLYA